MRESTRRVKSPRQKYSEKIRCEIFREGITLSYIANISGISYETVRAWKRDPGRMPAFQYLRLIDALEGRRN